MVNGNLSTQCTMMTSRAGQVIMPIRIIARLDIKGSTLIKGVHLEGWRAVGNPAEFSEKYYLAGIDEIIYIDCVASLYSRDLIKDIVENVTKNVFIPLTVGGGVKTVDDAYELLNSGADKIAINTGAIKRPALIKEASERFGRQCVVASIAAKKVSPGRWEAYFDSAREPTGFDVVEWARELAELGAGEILLTSIEREGTGRGFDVDLVKSVSSAVNIPVIVGGGFGKPPDLVAAVENGASAAAIADAFHYDKINIGDLKAFAEKHNIPVRSH